MSRKAAGPRRNCSTKSWPIQGCRPNGGFPDQLNAGLGTLLYLFRDSFTGKVVPAELYDGIVDSAVTGPSGNPMQICFKNNANATFVNLHADQFNAQGTNLPQVKSEDATPFRCDLPALAAVTIAAPPDVAAGGD